MSDPKRASPITVNDPKSAKNKVTKTVRLTINLDESNESKYPVLNYKELLEAAERLQRTENGKTLGLDLFSDNDDDVEMRAKKFEQKYGSKSTYGKKGRSKGEYFADIGAGYDENDPFIDNTDGYDEMVPPECDTIYGGFYINCGSLEFKTVQHDQNTMSDVEMAGNKRNKRRLSSSSSDEESSDSSSDSDSHEAKHPAAITNATVDSHKTEHRKKKNKKIDEKKAKKIRRTDSSAATSGKQTSDDNAHHGDGESADSRTSQSDSLTSKPAPSSENAITSDSSRDVEPKVEVKLPAPVVQVLEELEAAVGRQLADSPNITAEELKTRNEQFVLRIERIISKCSAHGHARRAARRRLAAALRPAPAAASSAPAPAPRALDPEPLAATTITVIQPPPSAAPTVTTIVPVAVNKRKMQEDLEELDVNQMTPEEKEAKIVETLKRLKDLIEERKPGMISAYNAECERVKKERKEIQKASAAEGAPVTEKRLPKRRFPWCPSTRALLIRLTKLAHSKEAASTLLISRALPLFPSGFVRIPTFLKQADLNKEIKASDLKRPRFNSTSGMSATLPPQANLPSSLTITTVKAQDRNHIIDESKFKFNADSEFGTIINSYSLSKEQEKSDDKKKDSVDKSKEDIYIPPNIGSITITPVPSNQKTDRKINNSNAPLEKPKESLIRVKSPAALNEMVKKGEDKMKKFDKVSTNKERKIELPLHIDTSYQSSKKEPSPKMKLEEINTKQIEAMRLAENNIPRPGLIAINISPTFAKPDKRPPDIKKKKDLVIVSDLDPLGEEAVAVDDSSSDVELIEERTDRSECANDARGDIVPSKDIVSDVQKKAFSVQARGLGLSKDVECHKKAEQLDEETQELFDIVKSNLRELEHSQEPTKLNCNSYGESVINSAKHEMSSKEAFSQRNTLFGKAFRRTNSYEQY